MLSRTPAAWLLLTTLLISAAVGAFLFYPFSPAYADGVSPPYTELSVKVVALDDEAGMKGIMILCPDKAREMGLCSTDEKHLHAKYGITIEPAPPPEVSLTIACQVSKEPIGWAKYFQLQPTIGELRAVDATDSFKCSYVRTGQGTFVLDLALSGDPNDELLTAAYMLMVMITFGLLTRNVNATDVGDLCLLGYDIGKHPPPMRPSWWALNWWPPTTAPLGGLPCGVAIDWQRNVLGIPVDRRSVYSDIRIASTESRILPSIDGSIGRGEWSDAAVLFLRWGIPGDSEDYVYLYVKNDNDFLYVAIDSAPTGPALNEREISWAENHTIFAIWLYFDVDHDAQLKDGRDVAYVYIWPSGLNGFVRYSSKCEFAFFTWMGFTKEHEAFLRTSGCLNPVKPPASIQGQYNGVRSIVEMKVHLRGEDGIMTDVGQAVGLRIGAGESQGGGGSFGVLPFDGLIDLALASTVGTGGEAQPTLTIPGTARAAPWQIASTAESRISADEQRALVGFYAAISAVLILAVVMIIGRRRVKSMLLRAGQLVGKGSDVRIAPSHWERRRYFF